MTAAAEQQVITSAAQKEETLNVQKLIDRHTKDLKVGPLYNTLIIIHLFYMDVNTFPQCAMVEQLFIAQCYCLRITTVGSVPNRKYFHHFELPTVITVVSHGCNGSVKG